MWDRMEETEDWAYDVLEDPNSSEEERETAKGALSAVENAIEAAREREKERYWYA